MKLSYSKSFSVSIPSDIVIDAPFGDVLPKFNNDGPILGPKIRAICSDEHKKSITIVDESEVNAKFDTIEKKISSITGDTKLYQEIKAQVKKELLDEFRNGELKRLKAEIVKEVVRSLKGFKDEL